MTDLRDEDRSTWSDAKLARERDDLREALAELRDRIAPQGLVSDLTDKLRRGFNLGSLGETAGSGAKHLLKGVNAGATPLVKMAGSAAKANPVAAALVGAGAAWLAYSAVKSHRAAKEEALPEWLREAGSLQERAEALRDRIAEAEEKLSFSREEAQESLEEIDETFARELRRLMGQGLDGLDAETRKAAFAAREAAFDKHYGKGGGLKFGSTLTYGAALAAAGTALASFWPRQSHAETQELRLRAAVDEAVADARSVIEDEAARLAELADALAEALNAAKKG